MTQPPQKSLSSHILSLITLALISLILIAIPLLALFWVWPVAAPAPKEALAFYALFSLSVLAIAIWGAKQSYRRPPEAVQTTPLESSNLSPLLMQAPAIINVFHGPEHVFIMSNTRAKQVALGIDRTGMKLRDAYPELKNQGIIEIFDHVYRTGESYCENERRVELLTTDGGLKPFYFNITYLPWRDASGQIAGVMDFDVDVTDQVLTRQKAEAAEARLRIALSASKQAAWDYNFVEDTLDGSDELWHLFGLDRPKSEQARRHSFIDRLHPEDRERTLQTLREAIQNKQDYRNEYRTIWPDGSEHWISTHGRILCDKPGQPTHIVGVSADITASKNFERQLEQAKDEAERANKLKSIFLANMSHEIRTPLGALIGYTQLLKDSDLAEEERQKFVDIMARNGEQLNHVLNDILDLSKVEAGQMRLEFSQVSPQKIVDDVKSLFDVQLREKDLRLETHVDDSSATELITDPTRLRQILSNIIGNAIKFTSAGTISISIRSADQKTYFLIQDTGIGIPKAQQENIFQFFVQADNSMTRKFGGTGLGLPLSRRLCRLLGGDLVLIDSRPTRGTTFEISVCTKMTSTPAQRDSTWTPPVASTQGQKRRILVVEDSVDNQELIGMFLSRAGLDVDFASDGRTGVSMAKSGLYDVVLMDIQMPEMDGYTAVELLREQGFNRPVLALTAHALTEFRQRGRAAGFNEYLTKPIRRQDLLAAIFRHAPPPPAAHL